MEGVRCVKCAHFFITWITATPYGCNAWGIRTVRYPQYAVMNSSGMECQLFSPKKPGTNKPGPSKPGLATV